VPVAAAAVDRDHRERWQAGLNRLGQPLFDTTGHHARGILTLTVQGDDRAQWGRLTWRAGDGPIGAHAAARRRHERAGDHRGSGDVGCGLPRNGRRQGSALARHRDVRGGDLGRRIQRAAAGEGARGAHNGSGAESQNCATAQVRHAGHPANAFR
jgi:hypothetical protein